MSTSTTAKATTKPAAKAQRTVVKPATKRAAKPATKATAKPAPKKQAATPQPEPQVDRRPARSNEEWDKLAKTVIVPMLQAGHTMTEVRAKYGAGPTIRRALDRVGYDTKGRQVQRTTIKASGKALAAKVAKRREQGAAWWRIQHETGQSEDDLKELLAKHGYGKLADGRVIISARGKAKAQASATVSA